MRSIVTGTVASAHVMDLPGKCRVSYVIAPSTGTRHYYARVPATEVDFPVGTHVELKGVEVGTDMMVNFGVVRLFKYASLKRI